MPELTAPPLLHSLPFLAHRVMCHQGQEQRSRPSGHSSQPSRSSSAVSNFVHRHTAIAAATLCGTIILVAMVAGTFRARRKQRRTHYDKIGDENGSGGRLTGGAGPFRVCELSRRDSGSGL
jgi:hypothetical protein